MATESRSASVSSEEEYDDDAAPHESTWQSQQNGVSGADANIDDIGSSPSQPKRPTIPVQKRRRVTRACDECRRKKIKCDGKQPCTHCTVYSYECTYDQPSNRRRNPAPQYVEALEIKLQRAEAILKNVLPDMNLDDPSLDDRYSLDVQAYQNGQSADKRRSRMLSSSMKARPSQDGEKDSMLESMVQDTASLDLDDDGHWDFHGHSSGRAFLRKMRQQFGDLMGTPEKMAMPSMRNLDHLGPLASPSPASSGSPWHALPPGTSELPSKHCALNLCRNALDDACAILRFVHKPSFYAMFDRIYNSSPDDLGPEELKFIPLLYSTLALGSLFATNEQSELQAHGLENAIDQGTHWFRTARSMMDVFECRDLTSLQCMLFMVLFLQSSSRLSTCYSHLGMVLRSAIRMGLHRSVSNTFNPVELELRKRIFWCVRKLDIYVGALLGFPKMLLDEDIDQEYPLEIDDEYVTTEGILPMPPGAVSLMTAFNAHTRIVDILAKTVKYIYPIKGPKNTSSHAYIVSHARIREIEQDLQNWSEELPEAFRSGGEAPREFLRIQHLLRMAYAHIEMILYRPFLHYVSPDIHTKSFDKRSYACAAACVSVSRNIVHLTGDMKKNGLLVGSYWFYMYTTFFAVISLVFYVLENPQSGTSAEILRDAYEGKDTLTGLARRSLAAQKCSKALSDLFEQLNDRLNVARMDSGPQKKKRPAPQSLPLSRPQMLQSGPEPKLRPKADPNPSFRRSYTSPTLNDTWKAVPGSYDGPPTQPQMVPGMQGNYRRNSQDPLSPTDPNYGSTGHHNSTPSVNAFPDQRHLAGLGVPDLSAVMFPSEDPFVYPNQPITTLENQRGIKQEPFGSSFDAARLPVSTNGNYGNLENQIYGGMPAYTAPMQQDGYAQGNMSGMNTSQDALPMSAPGWIQQPATQQPGEPPATPLDQLFGEDWGGWINQGYRQQ